MRLSNAFSGTRVCRGFIAVAAAVIMGASTPVVARQPPPSAAPPKPSVAEAPVAPPQVRPAPPVPVPAPPLVDQDDVAIPEVRGLLADIDAGGIGEALSDVPNCILCPELFDQG